MNPTTPLWFRKLTLIRVCAGLAFLIALQLWSQVDNNGVDASADILDQTRMLIPAPVNGQPYATAGTAEIRSNYLSTGVVFDTAYDDNVLFGATPNSVSDVSYSIRPTIALDETTARLHSLLTYSPGFTFYQHTHAFNQMDQDVGLDFQYQLSPHVTTSVRDSFQRTSNVLNQPALFAEGVYGSPQVPSLAAIPPLADTITNTINAELTYQFSKTGMIGGGGTFTNLHYPNPAEVSGLYDSSSQAGSTFYSRHLSRKHYLGAVYQYSRIAAYPTGSSAETHIQAAFGFYTVYLKPNLSLSVSGGPQHAEIEQVAQAAMRFWSPAATLSLGWQGRRTALATSYSRTITSGGGLVGAFRSNSVNTSARWQLTKTWSAGLAGNYATYRTLTPLLSLVTPRGHLLFGTASLQRQLGEHFEAELGYTRLHQSFNGIPVISGKPDANREFISISYSFSRPLGR